MNAAPCPFCGSEAKINSFVGSSGKSEGSVSCENRECVQPETYCYRDVSDAIARWNRRASPSAVAPSTIPLDVQLMGILDSSLDAEDAERLKRAKAYAQEVLDHVEAAPKSGPLKRDLNDNESLLAWAVDYLTDALAGARGVAQGALSASRSAIPASRWNEALDAAAAIADREWVGENSLIGSRVSRKIADAIRDLKSGGSDRTA